jgi:hypothetical protein
LSVKDYAALVISLIALGISLYNLYVQRFRRRVSLVGSMISVGNHDGEWDRKMEYTVSNAGDVLLAVKEIEYSMNGKIVPTEVKGLPVVLKPGEIALIDILYKSSDIEENSTEVVEIGVFSAIGKGYRLPHKHTDRGKRVSSMWDVFELKNEHKGF